jgi:hypothetical protein
LAKENSLINIVSRKIWWLLRPTRGAELAKSHNVKTSPHRQVKAQVFRILLRSILLFLSFLLQNVNAAEEPVLSEAKRSRMDADSFLLTGTSIP